MKLLIHSQYYPPEIGAPQARLSELAYELGKMGFEVTILTAMPNYPKGKIFVGYHGFFRKEIDEGIVIYRSFIFPTQSPSFFLRLLNYFSFVISSFFLGLFIPKYDLILTESPPLFLGITGFLLSRIKRARWIFNVSDLWPSSAVELGVLNKDSFGFKVAKVLEGFFYKKAWLITGQSNTILNVIKERFPGFNTYHLSNGVDTELFFPLYSAKSDSKIKVMYAGLHGLAQGLDQIISAASLLKANTLIEFSLIGDGPEKRKLVSLAKDLKATNVYFKDSIPKDKVPVLLSAADMILIPLKVQLTGAVPSKLYEAMASGKPVILIAESEAATIVNEADCGIVVRPGDINGLVEAIRFLAMHPDIRSRMGMNGRSVAVERFNRKEIARKFYQFLNDHF